MGIFFGTDGFRGKTCETLTAETAFRVGNALARICEGSAKILIGTDTRLSADYLTLAFCSGAVSVGADVVYVGVCPTAGISFLTKKHQFDFGVVISASHNPAEYNGIKIFNKQGKKLGDEKEREIEKLLLNLKTNSSDMLGRFQFDSKIIFEYEEFLKETAISGLKCATNFSELSVVLDCSNGSASKIAPVVFENLGTNVVCVGCDPDGKNINNGCGSLHIECLRREVLKNRANIGFAYDGDSDRVIAVTDDGVVVDGDQIVYIFAKYYYEKNKLNSNFVVGTKHTNMGIEKELNKIGISLIRTDIGDKFVSEELEKNNLLIGGEQSGHIFVYDKLQTGDGILNSLLLSLICINEKKKLSELICKQTYHQKNINIKVENKEKIIKNTELISLVKDSESKMNGKGRIMVRCSGTEPIIRVMSESEDEESAEFVAEKLEKMIRKIDSRGGLCVE